MSRRQFQVVLFGATGFTGKLVAEYLVGAAPEGLRWALAGRNLAKLEAVRAGLGPAYAELPLVVADSHDRAALDELASSTDVVCTTVGPYWSYGKELVAACAEAGTHYCDLTGETPFIRHSIDAHHERAGETGARIVHCCGYDSIPSDLGTLMLEDAMVEAGAPAERVVTYVGPSKGGISGGTIASMLTILELAGEDRDLRRVLAKPYTLDPADGRGGVDGRDQVSPAYDAAIGQWTATFVMAAINTRVVRRTHALLGYPWGLGFSYQETMAVGDGLKGRVRAYGISAGLGAFVAAVSVPPLRALLTDKVLPSPGEGPDEQTREAGYFRHLVLGWGADASHRMVGHVIGVKDPGYGETAKMLGESALCLALDGATLPDRAGVLTPATGMGQALIKRLRDAGMTFSVEPWPSTGMPRP